MHMLASVPGRFFFNRTKLKKVVQINVYIVCFTKRPHSHCRTGPALVRRKKRLCHGFQHGMASLLLSLTALCDELQTSRYDQHCRPLLTGVLFLQISLLIVFWFLTTPRYNEHQLETTWPGMHMLIC